MWLFLWIGNYVYSFPVASESSGKPLCGFIVDAIWINFGSKSFHQLIVYQLWDSVWYFSEIFLIFAEVTQRLYFNLLTAAIDLLGILKTVSFDMQRKLNLCILIAKSVYAIWITHPICTLKSEHSLQLFRFSFIARHFHEKNIPKKITATLILLAVFLKFHIHLPKISIK